MRKFAWMALAAVLLAWGTPLPADEMRWDPEAQRIEAIKLARKSVVGIRTYKPGQSKPGIGSGVILRSDGYILTNWHVIKEARNIKVHLYDGKEYTAKVWKSAPKKDLVLLKIEATRLPVARIGNSDAVELGQTAIAIGDPLGFEGSVTVGTVSGLKRDVQVKGIHYEDLIQTDAAINPGSSGGALINLRGEVVGINCLVYTGPKSYKHAQGLGFAIPINQAITIARKLVLSQPIARPRPWLGITAETLDREKAMDYGTPVKLGVLVVAVMSGSPAEKSGLQVGDVITQVDGRTVRNVPELAGELESRRPGDEVMLTVWRGRKKRAIPAVLDMQSQ